MRTATAALLLAASVAATASAASSSSSGTASPQLQSKDVTGLCGDSKSFAGYVTINEKENKNYFFWAFESQNDPTNDPVVLWMTGGPGCSSELALLYENGPCHVNDDGTSTRPNMFSWNKKSNMIFIDQPAGVGYSYSDLDGYDSNEAQVANDMYKFLQGFFEDNPSWRNNDFYVVGESYGGHFAPATANRVLTGNQQNEGAHINLKGLAIGNGLTQPLVQYDYFAPLAYNYSIEKVGSPRVTFEQYEGMVAAWPKCQELISRCQFHTAACPEAQSFCDQAMMGPYESNGWNPYDIRKKCGSNPLCYDFSPVTKWLQQPSVTKALGVTGRQWQLCNFQVNGMFTYDWAKDFGRNASALLEANLKVLFYAGDVGFVCNWLGVNATASSLTWSGQEGFNTAPVQSFTAGGSPAGEFRTHNGLTFLRVYNAGHMVPADQPEAALEMIQTFTMSSFDAVSKKES